MSGVLSGYESFMQKYQDPRTKDWFLSGKLGHLAIILISYVYFCTKAGPRFMKDRKPFELKLVIQLYNLFQIIISLVLVHEGIMGGWGTSYSFWCSSVDRSRSPEAMRMASAVWLYYINKLIELLDTVFFVLRKKYNQVTYLHIYHHTLMPICAYIGVTFLPGGHGTLLGVINSFIHVIMYTYYFASSLGPQYQKYLWWKKHVTVLQMIQFCIIFFHNFQVLFRPCDYPKFLNGLLSTQAAYFLYLFGSFYVRAYIKKKPQKTVVEKTESASLTSNEQTKMANGQEKIANGQAKFANGQVKIANGHVNGSLFHKNSSNNNKSNEYLSNGDCDKIKLS